MPDASTLLDVSVRRYAALRFLCTLGWQYLSPQAYQQKRGDGQSMVLQSSLLEAMRQYQFLYGGESHHLSSSAIEQVMRELGIGSRENNWQQLNKKLYHAICSGTTVTEFLAGGARHNATVPIIDWEQKKQNVFEVSEHCQFATKDGTGNREVDLVCYVNGIALCLILVCDDIESGIEQHVRNQQPGEIPHLYAYAQLLVVLGKDGAVYGSNQTPEKFWTRWHEEEINKDDIARLKQATLPNESVLLTSVPSARRSAMKAASALSRGQGVNDIDQILCGLLSPARLLMFLPNYVVFDTRGGKLLARSHQFFAVRILIDRLANHKSGERAGGVIWHTAGSGKSLTMVLLIQMLRRHPLLQDCGIVVVTDRLDLENQLLSKFEYSGSFGDAWRKCCAEKVKAYSAHDLARRIGNPRDQIIFSLLHKFNDALLLEPCQNPSDKMIVLIDEAHRSHGGQLHQRMRKVLKRAAFVAFTGTPLLKHEKTVGQFGPILHSYTMQRALQEKMITPLLYEERIPELVLNHAAIDAWLEENSAPSSAAPALAPPMLYASLFEKSQLYRIGSRIDMIAQDIAHHFNRTIKLTALGLKGLVATATKQDAIAYKYYLDQTGLVTSAVIISPPDPAGDPAIQAWWDEHVGTKQNEYEARTLARFAGPSDLDLLILVDRLLTGFDQPRAAVLYIDKPLQDHGLIQAIARVNRLHDEKLYGRLIDYRGILKPLDTALLGYRKLEQAQAYDAEDLCDLYRNFASEYQRLPQRLAALEAEFAAQDWVSARENVLPAVTPRTVHLVGKNAVQTGAVDLNYQRRKMFFQRLYEYRQCLYLGLSSTQFFDEPNFSDSLLQHYKERLRFFVSIANRMRPDKEPVQDVTNYVLQGMVQTHRVQEARSQYLIVANDENQPENNAQNTPKVTPLLAYNQVQQWSEEKIRMANELICANLNYSISLEMEDHPYAKKTLAASLQQCLNEMNGEFTNALNNYTTLVELQERVAQRRVAGLPRRLQENPDANVYYGIFMLVLDEACIAIASSETLATWEKQALEMAEWIENENLENSLNQSGLDEIIRHRLIRELIGVFVYPKFLTLSQVLAMVEQVLRVVRLRIRKQTK